MLIQRRLAVWSFLIGLTAVIMSFGPAQVDAKTVKVEMTAVETEVVVDGEGTKYSAW
nr:hypothetical protein [Nitrospirales bacterium]